MNKLCISYGIKIEQIKSIEWKTQNSKNNSILFYKINDSEEAVETFLKRIQKTSYMYCVVNKNIETTSKNIIVVKESEYVTLQKEICDQLIPYKKTFKSVCVTGTNGKTTTVDLLRQIVILSNKNILTIGTLGVWLNKTKVSDFGLTSPSYIDFRKILHRYGKDISVLAVEVSSHALQQKRFFEFEFDYGAWTSFSQDHLDYHKTMEEYFKVKSKIFDITKNTISVILKEKFIEKIGSNKLKILDLKEFKKNSFLQVSYNKKNMTIALDLALSCGIDVNDLNLEDIVPPPGRFNIIDYKNGYIVIDFAHTPDALKNICLEIKKSFPTYDLITIFGCGGDRDKTKRPLMGKVAIELSDYVYVTSDNPRFENPEKIIDDIIIDLNNNKYEIVVQREQAIKKSLLRMDNEIILITGKGHEKYIDQNGKKRPYSDEEVVRKVIKNDNCK